LIGTNIARRDEKTVNFMRFAEISRFFYGRFSVFKEKFEMILFFRQRKYDILNHGME